MKSKFSFALLLFFIATGSASAHDRCGGFGGLSEWVCSTSHIQILSNREKYDGKMVDFRSVVHRTSETEIHLFPFNESRELGVIEDMIRLDESAIEALNKHKIKSGDWIRVVGRFKSKDSVEFQQYFGVVADVFLVVPIGLHRHLFQREQEEENQSMN